MASDRLCFESCTHRAKYKACDTEKQLEVCKVPTDSKRKENDLAFLAIKKTARCGVIRGFFIRSVDFRSWTDREWKEILHDDNERNTAEDQDSGVDGPVSFVDLKRKMS